MRGVGWCGVADENSEQSLASEVDGPRPLQALERGVRLHLLQQNETLLSLFRWTGVAFCILRDRVGPPDSPPC